MILFCAVALAAPKPHAVAFGKWITAKWPAPNEGSQPQELKIRPLYIDGHTKEFTLGSAHPVTDRAFVVRRMFRVNDSLPQETGAARWQWQPGGWLLVDQVNGKVQLINLPEFEPSYSTVNWFRDYAAYCGISDDGKKAYALIVQLGRRKPLLKKLVVGTEMPACAAPLWQRDPVRATFEPNGDHRFTFSVTSRAVDFAGDEAPPEQ